MSGIYEEVRLALYQVWLRRWLALGIAWAVCLIGWLVVSLIPNSYQTTANIYVQSQEMLSGKLGNGELAQRRDREKLEKTLTSSVALEQVVRTTGLGEGVETEADLARAVANLREGVALLSTKENLFELTVTLSAGDRGDARTAQLTRDVAARMIDVFREQNMASGRAETQKAVGILNEEIEQRRASLERAEQARTDFETRNLALLPGAQSASTRATAARAELGQIDSQLIQAQSSLAALNGQLAGTPRTIAAAGPGGQSALGNAEAQLAAMRARGLTDQHPDVVAIKREIQSLRAQGGSASQSFQQPNPAYAQLASMQSQRQAEVAALRARKAALEQEMAQLTGQLASEPGVSAEYDRLTREYNVQKEQYEELLAERENVSLRGNISSEADAVTFRVVDPPTVPLAPAAPNRLLLLTGILFVGLAAGAGGAFGIGQLKSSFSSPLKLERASGLPVLGSITETPTAAERDRRRKRQRLFYGAVAALPILFMLIVAVFSIDPGGPA